MASNSLNIFHQKAQFAILLRFARPSVWSQGQQTCQNWNNRDGGIIFPKHANDNLCHLRYDAFKVNSVWVQTFPSAD